MAAAGLPTEIEMGGESGLGDLPASTAMALGFGVPDDAVQRMIDMPPPAKPARYDLVKARHHVDVELI